MVNYSDNKVGKFLKTSAIYFLGKVATYVVSFVMLRYYTNHISPTAYGNFEYISSIINVAIPVLFVEIWSGVLRLAIEGDKSSQTRVITTTLFLIFPFICLYSIIFYIINDYLGIYTELIFAYSLSFLFVNLMMMITRALGRNKLFAYSGIVGATVNAITGYVCIKYFQLEEESLMCSNIANYVLQILFLAFGCKIWEYVSISEFSAKIARRLLLFCAPFGVNSILYYLNTNYYRIVVDSYLGANILGLFTVSTKFCVIVTFVVSIFHLSWQELTYSLPKNTPNNLFYSEGLDYLCVFVSFGTIIILPFVKILYPFFVGSEYSCAESYIPIYYITIYFTSISGFLYNTLAAEKITIYHPFVKAVSVAVNLLLMYSLILKIGIYAIIVASIISSIIEMIILFVVCEKKLKITHCIHTDIYFITLYIVSGFIFIKCGILYNSAYLLLCIFLFLKYLFKKNPDILVRLRIKR